MSPRIVEPEQRVEDFANAGADIISVHCEALRASGLGVFFCAFRADGLDTGVWSRYLKYMALGVMFGDCWGPDLGDFWSTYLLHIIVVCGMAPTLWFR